MQEININVTETGCQRSPLLIGYQGENEVTRVIVDYSAWAEEFGAGSLALEVMRSGDEIPYLAPLTFIDDKAVWLVSNVDTGAHGEGAAGFVFTVGEQVKKSAVFRFFVGRDVGGTPGDRPDPYESLITYMEKLLAQTEENAAAAETAQTAAETAQTAAEAAQTAAASSETDAAGSATTATEQAQAAATARAAAEAAQQAAETAQGAAEAAKTAAETAQTAAVAAKTATETARDTAISTLQTEGAAQKAAIQQKGAEVLESIPEDYTDLSDEVDDLKSAVNEVSQATTATTLAPASIVTFEASAADMPIKALTVNIEPVQSGSGDPSPTNVRPISGWTGCNVTRTGKNLLDINAVTSGAVDHNTGEVVPNTSNKVTPLIRCEPNTTYVVSGFERAIRHKYYRSTIEYIGEAASTTSSTFTTPADCHFMRIQGINIAWSGAVNPQLELGSTATDYEPYQGDTYNITFPSPDPGTVYGGTLDVTAGVLTVDRANIASYSGETLPGKWISDRDVYAAGTIPTTGAQVVYELATHIEITLTPTQIDTLLGTNNIWADCGDVTVTYGAYLETIKKHAYRTAEAQDVINELLGSTIPGTTQTVTFDTNGNPQSIVHTANNAAVRTDVFTWGENSVTELRTLANGKHITITTNLTTLETVITGIEEAV